MTTTMNHARTTCSIARSAASITEAAVASMLRSTPEEQADRGGMSVIAPRRGGSEGKARERVLEARRRGELLGGDEPKPSAPPMLKKKTKGQGGSGKGLASELPCRVANGATVLTCARGTAAPRARRISANPDGLKLVATDDRCDMAHLERDRSIDGTGDGFLLPAARVRPSLKRARLYPANQVIRPVVFDARTGRAKLFRTPVRRTISIDSSFDSLHALQSRLSREFGEVPGLSERDNRISVADARNVALQRRGASAYAIEHRNAGAYRIPSGEQVMSEYHAGVWKAEEC